MSSCPCAVSLLCSLICGLSPILCLFLSFSLSPFVFLWGCGWKPSLFYFFFRERWIFQFCIFLSLFCAPSFFQAPLMCLWIRYHSVWMSSQTWMRGHSHALSHTHTHALSFYTRNQRHPHASVHSSLFVSIFHALLHPHHSPYNS